MLAVPAGDNGSSSAALAASSALQLGRSLSSRSADPESTVEHHPLDVDPEKKLRKRLKKQQKKDKEGDDATADDLVAFVLPSGEVLELRQYTGEVQSKYDVKIHMANERTFFKYLFSGFHLGAMGTFLITYFPQGTQFKPFLIAATWLAAFSFIFWGLYAYYHRKALMLDGRVKDLTLLNLHGPAYVLCMFLLVFSAIILYADYTHQYPSKHAGPAAATAGASGWGAGPTGADGRPIVPLPIVILGGGE